MHSVLRRLFVCGLYLAPVPGFAAVAFVQAPKPVTQNYPSGIAVADLNGDGKPDLAVTNQGADTVSVFLGNGNGTFLAGTTFGVGSNPSGIATLDANGDGKVDLVVANSNGGSLSLLFGLGTGNFLPAFTYATGTSPNQVAVGDLDGDGKADVVSANIGGGVSVLLGSGQFGPAAFAAAQTFDAATPSFHVALADLDGDGKLDVVAADYTANAVAVFRGNGSGALPATPVSYPSGLQPKWIAIGDLDRDGHPEIASADFGASALSLFHNQGNGVYAAAAATPYDSGSIAAAFVDVDHDGRLDLVAVSYNQQRLWFRTGRSDGSLGPLRGGAATPTGPQPVGLVVADVNRDGSPDLLVPNRLDNSVSVLLNDVIFADGLE